MMGYICTWIRIYALTRRYRPQLQWSVHLLMAGVHLVSLHVEGLPQLLLEHLVPVLLLSLLHLPQLIGVVCRGESTTLS